ncbi:MAG: flagellar M-ring protein FliF [Acidobacteria bacterium]|nr:flagellar M-ring protein FliF [Acidobacteriota bacterium]
MSSPLTQIKETWERLPMKGRIATIAAAVATLGLVGALVYYGSQPDYAVLFSDLNPTDAQSIVDKLKAENVPYSLTNGGTTISVPQERISELRLQVAASGAISGGHVGFDLFDKTSFGATDFAQQVNYRRAIEGELSKTLEGMDEVDSARVHITPQKESVFTEKEEGAKASVMLKVKQNKELSPERTDAIVSLLASSVEGLDPSNVSVMDTRGRLLVAAGRGKSGGLNDAGAFHAQLEAKQKYEMESAARIIALLEPVVGQDRVRADVAADIDFSQIEQNEEKYNPQSQVVRSQQTSQEARNSNSANPNGVVGARSNNPTTASPSPTPAASTTGDSRNTATVNYEIDKTVRKTIGGGGRVSRMTVSVVVDNKTVNGVEVARTPDEIKQIQDLVGGAIGIDPNRGDSVVVQTMPFDKPADTATPPSTLDKYKQFVPSALKYGALVLIALLLLWFVILPARKALKAAAVPETDQARLLEGAKSEESEEEEKRLEETETPKQLEENHGEIPPLTTVADLEAQMNAEDHAMAELPPVNEEILRIENIKKQIIDQSLNDTETVVSTLRGWLRETT